MTQKDWILLLIPLFSGILLQGIILFVFQKKITLHLENKNKNQASEFDIQQKFKNYAFTVYEHVQIMIEQALVPKTPGYNSFEAFNDNILEMLNYFRINDMVLGKFQKNTNQLIRLKLEFNRVLEKLVKNLMIGKDDSLQENDFIKTGIEQEEQKVIEEITDDEAVENNFSLKNNNNKKATATDVYMVICDMLDSDETIDAEERDGLEKALNYLEERMSGVDTLYKICDKIKEELKFIIKKS